MSDQLPPPLPVPRAQSSGFRLWKRVWNAGLVIILAGVAVGVVGVAVGMFRTFGNTEADIKVAAGQITGGIVLAITSIACGLIISAVGSAILVLGGCKLRKLENPAVQRPQPPVAQR